MNSQSSVNPNLNYQEIKEKLKMFGALNPAFPQTSPRTSKGYRHKRNDENITTDKTQVLARGAVTI